MLIEIHDKIISTQIFDRKFVCDLNACRGACCIKGDAGAPLEEEEANILEENIDKIKPFMRKEGIEEVDKTGVFYIDQENDMAATLVNEKECAFVFFDEKGITKCAIEKAQSEGVIDFKKPLSCHLYPIRVKRFNDFTALNYNHWDICEPACSCGEKFNVPVYKFLRDPLIRAFGSTFYEELEIVNSELKKITLKNNDVLKEK
jgi:hypothetical protein